MTGKTVAVFGVFDGLHEGHKDFLRQARACGDTLIAIVAQDRSVQQIKGKSSLLSQKERLVHVQNSGLADKAMLGDEELSSYKVLEAERPDIVCVGYDQHKLKTDLLAWIATSGANISVVELKPYKAEAYHTSLLQPKGNFKVNDDFSPLEFNQTDFGRIYFNLPQEILTPSTIEELAAMLASCHKAGKQVTIRNTGHSVNGQTLTQGTQVNIGDIKGVSFDEGQLQVTAGAGVSWDEILQTIRFPEYALPVIPMNPGQQIKIGGTLAVGGEGFSSSRQGGLWNHVISLKLVTMTGDVIECSREKNPLYFKFALGGFGRIGVIAEATMRVQKSSSYQLVMVLCSYRGKDYYNLLKKVASDPLCDSLMLMEYLGGFGVLSRMFQGIVARPAWPRCLWLIKDVYDKQEDLLSFVKHVKRAYGAHFSLYAEYKRSTSPNFDLSFHPHLVSRKDIAYFYPQSAKENQLDLHHPWLDCVLPGESYEAFVEKAKSLIRKYAMEKYLTREAFFSRNMDVPLFGTYMIKNMTTDFSFPLSLDLPGQEYTFGVSILPAVPSQEVDRALAMNKEITALSYRMGGKLYLYCSHELTKMQVEKQFGKEAIGQWNRIKRDLDPFFLLNRGVIEHLDEYV